MDPSTSDTADTATYEDLAALEREFDDVDTQIIAQQYLLSLPLYRKRAALVTKIENFWPLVFEQAPEEIDAFIQPSDSEILISSLTGFEVDRPWIPDPAPKTGGTLESNGSPRSVRFKFEFRENVWFEDRDLEKEFHYRRSMDGEVGLVSTPVKINWKQGKDVTGGATDAAVRLHKAVEEREARRRENFEGLREMVRVKEYKEVQERVAEGMEGSLSFFAWFAYRGRHVSQKEHEEAEAALKRGKKLGKSMTIQTDAKGEILGEDDAEEEATIDSELFPAGEELATHLSEELWPNALKYFTSAQEDDDDEDMSDLDVSAEDDIDEDENDIPDIRSLVKDSQKKNGPPTKKRKM